MIFFPKEQAEHFQAKDRAVLDSKSLMDIPEEQILTRNGDRILHTRKIPILNTNGEPEYLVGISEDITEKKNAEAQKLRLAEETAARTEAERASYRMSILSEASAILSSSLEHEKDFGQALQDHRSRNLPIGAQSKFWEPTVF